MTSTQHVLLSLAFSVVGVLGAAELHAAVHLRGRVESSGGALKDVEISVARMPSVYEDGQRLIADAARPEPVDSTHSGSDGRFRLAVPEPGMWVVRASKDGFAPMEIELFPLLEDTDLPRLELSRDRGLEFRVMTTGSSPVPGARILVEAEEIAWIRENPGGSWRLGRQLARADENGRAILKSDHEGSVVISVFAPGHVPETEVRRSGAGGTVVLQQAPAHPVGVTDHRGRPLADVLVWQGRGGLPVGKTDRTGRVTLFGSAGSRESFRFLGAEGQALETALPPRGGDDRADEGRESIEEIQEIRLAPPRALGGRVLSIPHREPVAGALVWRDRATFARTGAGGDFRLVELPWVDGALRWGAPGFLADRARDERLPGNADAPTLVLRPAGVVIGIVTDGGGRPIPGVEVKTRFDPRSLGPIRFNPPEWQRMSGGVARTAEDGRFRLGDLVPGLAYAVRLEREGYAPSRITVEAVLARHAAEEHSIVLERGIQAYGKVLDLDGMPVVGAVASLEPARPHDVMDRVRRMRDPPTTFMATSDESGLFRFSEVPPGSHDLLVEAQGFARQRVAGVRVDPGGASATDLGIVHLGPEARVRGRVESTDGQPIGDVAVRIVPDEGVLALVQDQLEPAPDAWTAEDGRFELGGFTKGEPVPLRFDREGYAVRMVRSARGGGEPIVVRLEATTTLHGVVQDPDGAPIPGVLVLAEESVVMNLAGGQVADAGKPTSLVDTTDDRGEFHIEGVAGGPHRLHAEARGWQSWSGRVPRPRESDGEAIEIVLQPAAIVEGVVRSDDGQPVVDAEIHRWLPEIAPGGISYHRPLARTDGNGFYRIEDLAPGRARLEARHPAAGREVREVEALPGDNSLDFQLEGGHRVSGQVLDPTGAPVGGARVVLSSRLPSWTPPITVTDGVGYFSFEGVSPGRYGIGAEKRGIGRSADGVSLEVIDGPVDDLSVPLVPLGSVAGRLLGLGPEDLGRVRLHAGGLLDIGRVDYDGRYEILELSPGSWTIIAEVPGSDLRAIGSVLLEPDEPDAWLDLELDTTFALEGEVILDGAPVQGLAVTIFDRSGAVGWASTDARGRFVLPGLASGEYRLEVTAEDRPVALQRTVSIDSDLSISIQGTEGGSPGREPLP